MIDPKEGSCAQCGHYKNQHLEYINQLEKAGFYIWAIRARTKIKQEIDYCPEVEIKWTDLALCI